jgi:hypothetical protein
MRASDEVVVEPEDPALEVALGGAPAEVLLGAAAAEPQAAAAARTRAVGATSRIARERVRRCIWMLRFSRVTVVRPRGHGAFSIFATDASHERFIRPAHDARTTPARRPDDSRRTPGDGPGW